MSDQDLTTAGPTGDGIEAAARSVTAFFDTREAADKAKQDLLAAGVPLADVRVAGGEAPASAPEPQPNGFWESLKDFFVPDSDRRLYAEGLRRGGFAVSVKTDSAAYAHVIDLLDRDGAVDMEERSTTWGEGGTGAGDAAAWAAEERAFTPPSAGTAGFGASMADQPLVGQPSLTGEIEPGLVTDIVEDRMRARAGAPDSAYAAGAPGLGDTARDATARPGESQVEPAIVRDTSHGRTRIRSYLLDHPKGDGYPPV